MASHPQMVSTAARSNRSVLARAALAGAVATVLAAVASGCGGGERATPATTAGAPAPPLPACARKGAAVASTSDLPAGFPLPPGTRLASVERPNPGQLVVLGAIPADLQEATSFFSEVLPEHGYQVGVGDAEGSESEAPFTGNGYRGKWRVNEIPDCPALRLTLVLIEQS